MTNTQTPTVAEIRSDFIRKELAKGQAPAEAAHRWASYAAGPGYTYLSRIAKAGR